MSVADDIAAIRKVAGQLRFESPTRGATILMKLSYGLPSSETIKGLTEAQIAMEIIRKTIQHSHKTNGGLDQYGNGSWLWFTRHVTEGERRWDFEVEVTIDKQRNAVIDNVRIIRPGDDEPDPDDPDSQPEVEKREPITEWLPHGMIACPCCGHATISERGMYQICPVCFWEDDGSNDGAPLTAARASYAAMGACREADRAHVRPPTREEVKL